MSQSRRRADSRRRCCQGSALVELALVLPLLFLLIINVVNFGGAFYASITVANAARAGAQYMVMGNAWIFGLSPPSASQVTTVVTNDLLSLPNRTSAVIKVCINVSGTTTCNPSGGSISGDPEPSFYNSTSVDVTYTYQPFVRFWDFSNLGIHLTLPTTTIHRQVVMRCAGGCTVS